ncbi:retrotransposon protein, putative, ty1-copia subclass [Tanacetum coccineum]
MGRNDKGAESEGEESTLSIEFFDHLKNCDIVSQLSPPRTPQLNGVAERRNRTLPKDNVVFVARRGTFLEREMISKEDNGSKIDLEEIQESADEEPIVNTDTQQEVVTLVEPDDISYIILRTSTDAFPEAAKVKGSMEKA